MLYLQELLTSPHHCYRSSPPLFAVARVAPDGLMKAILYCARSKNTYRDRVLSCIKGPEVTARTKLIANLY